MDLISEEYRRQNEQLHQSGKYGRWGYRETENIQNKADKLECETILDFGCGQQTLSNALRKPVTNYDPAIEGCDRLPDKKHDMTVCSDVMEHIEPEYMHNVLSTIKSLTEKYVYFVITTTKDGTKTLPDGRDPHLIVQSSEDWVETISEYFEIEEWYNQQRRNAVVIIGTNK